VSNKVEEQEETINILGGEVDIIRDKVEELEENKKTLQIQLEQYKNKTEKLEEAVFSTKKTPQTIYDFTN